MYSVLVDITCISRKKDLWRGSSIFDMNVMDAR